MSGNGGISIEQMIPIGLAIAATVATDGAAAPLLEEAAGASLAGGALESASLGELGFANPIVGDIATGVAAPTWATGTEALNPIGFNDVVGNTGMPSPTTQPIPVEPPPVLQQNYLSSFGREYGGDVFGELGGVSDLTEPAVSTSTTTPTTEPVNGPVNVQQGLKIPGATNTQTPLTDATKQAALDKAAKDPSWWSTLSPTTKMAITGAGTLGLGALLKADNSRYGTPGTQTYTGPLSKFSYNPNTFTPTTVAQPTPYQPRYMAAGGIAKAKTNDMQAIDDYVTSTAQPGGMKALLAKAENGDYNAMIALNKIKKTPNQNYAAGGGIGTRYPEPDDGGVNTVGAHQSISAGPQYPMQGIVSQYAAGGGVGHLGGYSDGGRMLKGPGDGMSDDIPASIAGKQPARLADNEFVVPADVVSHLGNGSSDAGARKLYKMMDNVRKARTGKKKQAPQIKSDKYMPA